MLNTEQKTPSTNLRITSNSSSLVINIPWFYSRYGVASVLIVVIAIAFLRYAKDDFSNPDAWPFIIALILAHAWIFYFLLTKLINTTTLTIDTNTITTKHRPLPFRRGKTISYQFLTNISIEEKIYQGRSRRTYYNICIKTETKQDIIVVTFLEKHDQAKIIKEQMTLFMQNHQLLQ